MKGARSSHCRVERQSARLWADAAYMAQTPADTSTHTPALNAGSRTKPSKTRQFLSAMPISQPARGGLCSTLAAILAIALSLMLANV